MNKLEKREKQIRRENKLKEKNKKKINWYIILLAIGVFIVLIKGSLVTYDNYKLLKYGQEKKAIVTSKIWYGRKSQEGFYYYFKINESFFERHTFDQEYQPGDSIIVLYLKDNPKINAPLYYLKRVHPRWFNRFKKKGFISGKDK